MPTRTLIVAFAFFPLGSFCQITSRPAFKNIIEVNDSIIKTNVGKLFNPFIAKNLDGKYFSENKLKRKITVVNFWFATCRPCIEEFSEFNLLYKKFAHNKKFQMISLTFETHETALNVKKKYDLTYPILLTTADSCSDLSFKLGYPVTVITDFNGRIIHINAGGSIKKTEIRKHFKDEIIPKINKALKNKKVS